MVEPVTAPADAAAVGRAPEAPLAAPGRGLVAEGPAARDLKPFGLDAPALTLTWSTSPSFSLITGPPAGPEAAPLEDRSLIVGARSPGGRASGSRPSRGRPLVFTLGAEALGTIDAEFHDRRVLAFDPAHARRVRLPGPTARSR